MVVWEEGTGAHCPSSVPGEINVHEGKQSTNLQDNKTVLLECPGMEWSQSDSGIEPWFLSCVTLVKLYNISESQILICCSVFGEE